MLASGANTLSEFDKIIDSVGITQQQKWMIKSSEYREKGWKRKKNDCF